MQGMQGCVVHVTHVTHFSKRSLFFIYYKKIFFWNKASHTSQHALLSQIMRHQSITDISQCITHPPKKC